MKLKIDLKSLALGLIFAIVLILAAGAIENNNESGRYQIAMTIGETRVYYAVLDTQTGSLETWRIRANNMEERAGHDKKNDWKKN